MLNRKIIVQLYLTSFIICTTLFLQAQTNYEAGNNASAGSGENNTVVGANAGSSTATGSSNSFFGNLSGSTNSTGNFNAFFGRSTGLSNSTGNENTFVGAVSGANNSSGSQNSFFGRSAGLAHRSGFGNSFFGSSAGSSTTTSNFNSFFGRSAGLANTTGFNNSFFGQGSGRFITTGSFNVIIGNEAGPTTANSDVSNRLYIDIDESLSPEGNDDPLIYGEFDNDFVRINGTFEVTAGLTNPSSRTLKNQFISLDASTILSKLAALDIQQWTYIERPDEKHVGPVAEDFYEAFGLVQVDQNVSTIDADGIIMLDVQALQKENGELKERLVKLEDKLK